MTASLWRHADFMKLWAGQTVSELGSVVTRTAVPLVALLVLGAGPFEMALLVVSASLGGAPRRLLRRRMGRPAPSTTAAHLGRRDPGRPAVLDPGGLPRRRAPDRAAVPRRVPRGLPGGALRCRLSGLRPVAHRGRSRRRGQQQARHELVARRDRRSGPRGRARAGDRRAVRDPRRRDLVRRVGDLAGPDPQPRAAAPATDLAHADPGRDRRGPAARPPAPGPACR